MAFSIHRFFATAATLFFLAGCTVFQPQSRPLSPLALPETYAIDAHEAKGAGRWWQSFGSSELNSLVDEALSGNFDIRTAWSRLRQADAVARQAGATRKATVDYRVGADKNRLQTKSAEMGTRQTDTQSFSAGLGAAYELDLWGRLEALHRSGTLELQAARQDLEAAAVTVTAEVVTTWVDIVAVRRQITILQDQIRINRNLLHLQQLRFVNGKAGALDVSQQREALAAANAKLPLLQLAQQQQFNVLAVLLGRSSAQGLTIVQKDLPGLIPIPGAGLPVDLLAARPDVRAAGLRLRAADWRVGAAQADRLPAITLSADAVFSSEALDLLFSNWISTLATRIAGPLFDAGYRSAEVDRSRAVAEAYLAEYAKTVATAIREVEDSLVTEKRQEEYIELLQEQLQASRLALKNARIQYMNGQNNYLAYLTAWTSIQDLERQLVQEQAALAKNRIGLYRAIGGDWTRELVSGAVRSPQVEPPGVTANPCTG